MTLDNSNNYVIEKDNSKRSRKYNAVKLPLQLNESMIPKYVVYYKECYNREKQLYREFFKIEKHPIILTKKIYTSSKSNKISILEKLEQIKTILEKIENDELNKDNESKEINECKLFHNEDQKNNKIIMPKYISLKQNLTDNNKYYLMYDKKTNSQRLTLKTLYTKDVLLKDNLSNFLQKIDEKFYKNNNLNSNIDNNEEILLE